MMKFKMEKLKKKVGKFCTTPDNKTGRSYLDRPLLIHIKSNILKY